jgi:hypothetical protein
MEDINSSYLLKENNKVYSHTNTKENYGIAEVKTFDLDGDGILEILSNSVARGDEGYILYGLKNKKYQMIAYLSKDTEFLKDRIYVRDSFLEFLSSKDEYVDVYPYKSKSHPKGTKLKYKKGKLSKIK